MLTVGAFVAACTAPDALPRDQTDRGASWEYGVVSWTVTRYPAGTQEYVTWQVLGDEDRVLFADGFMVNHSDEEVRDRLATLNDGSPYIGRPPSGEFLAYEVVARLGVKGWEAVDVEHGTHLITEEIIRNSQIRWYLKRRSTR